jgi:hypothetical protein
MDIVWYIPIHVYISWGGTGIENSNIPIKVTDSEVALDMGGGVFIFNSLTIQVSQSSIPVNMN